MSCIVEGGRHWPRDMRVPAPNRRRLPVLLLSRKCGQSIVINDDIVVTVVAVDRNRVQIGVRAPGYVPIFRQEIVERMVAEGEIEPLACLAPPQAVASPPQAVAS
jgi:carbon storage regulator